LIYTSYCGIEELLLSFARFPPRRRGPLAYVRRDPPVHVVRFVRYVTLIGDYYVLLRSRFALCLYGFCRVGLQLLGILERDERHFMPFRLFLYLQTMEKLQLYSHQKLCYNSLVSELRGALGRKYLLAAMLLQGEVSEGGVS